jgi:hypothetical protein
MHGATIKKLYFGSREVNLEYEAKYKSIAPRTEWTGVQCLEEAGRLTVILDKFHRPGILNNALGNSFWEIVSFAETSTFQV